ncbi:MAG: gamma-glutamyl-gamma-aminobutyrate hydrolase family protein [Cyanobium sp. MAG06]|nr:gamma-glutamyl-gamma-aminobutyrate hydrolase family protein [Cyanobium sp. MAG06]
MKNILIIDCNTIHLQEIETLAKNYSKNITILKEKDIRLDNKLTIGYELIIISGASNVPSLKYNSEQHSPLINYIKNINTKIIGICFGCEAIAVAYNCELIDIGNKLQNKQNVSSLDGELNIKVYEAHRFAISNISEYIEVLGVGENDSIEIIKHKNKPIIGTQFHIELSENRVEIMQYLIKNIS